MARFHGRTLATLNLNGKVAPYKQKVGVLPGPVYHLPFPSKDNGVTCAEALKAMERLFSVEIDVEDVACFIVEPVQGEAGFLAMDVEFAQALRSFCDEKGIVLIADEIQSGFGRTGQRFAFSRLGIEPDLILLGKSIAGGVPLGAVVGRKSLLDNLPKGGLGGTYSGNPIACAAALATLDEMTDANLQAWGSQQEEAIVSRYEAWRANKLSPYLGRLTGVGAMRGIELINADGTPASAQLTQLLALARDAGLLLMPSGKSRHIIRLAGAVDHRGCGAGGRAGYSRGVPEETDLNTDPCRSQPAGDSGVSGTSMLIDPPPSPASWLLQVCPVLPTKKPAEAV